MYHRRPVRKSIFSFLMPVAVVIAIFLIIILGWRVLNNFFGTPADVRNERVFMNIEQGSVKAMTAELSQWQNAPDKIYLYQGEMVKTGTDSRITLTYFDQSIVRLNGDSEIRFNLLRKKGDAVAVKTTLSQGGAWIKIEPLSSSDSSYVVDTELLSIDSRNGILAITAPGTIRVVKGEANIGIKYDDDVIKAVSLGIGQEVSVTQEIVSKLHSGEETELVSAWSEDFTKNDWYLWNRHKDGAIVAYEEAEQPASPVAEVSTGAKTGEAAVTPAGGAAVAPTVSGGAISKVVYVTSPSAPAVTNKEFVNIAGHYDPKEVTAVFVSSQKAALFPETSAWEVRKLKLLKEGANLFKLSATDLKGAEIKLDDLIVTYDKTPPPAPLVTEPGINGAKVAIQSPEQIIKGTVSADAQVVIVNDYVLSKYVPGSREFTYYAKVAYGNMIAGENLYQVFAEDKAGNRSEPAAITLVADQAAIDAAAIKSAPEATEESSKPAIQPEAETTGSVRITAPNDGKDLSTTETFFELRGTVPENTAKVVVNDYTLSAYQPGSVDWKYRASVQLGNLKSDEDNLFTVTAYDASGSEIGKDSIVITLSVERLTTPTFTMPTDKDVYSTNLNVITLGGNVSRSTEEVYLNGEKIPYEQGLGKWRKSVTLTPGDNVFRVYAVKGEQKSSVAKMTIKYY